jgi:hypothetical protein
MATRAYLLLRWMRGRVTLRVLRRLITSTRYTEK